MSPLSDIKIQRTGKVYSIAASEYLITFPNGFQQTIWSPPWNDFTEKEEDDHALEYAEMLWELMN
jgi:hypothetical protein